ncbi:MAG: succinate dehydrogenase cytochrome b subunit [bacterium]|nr:succinate dehydrogenase cytochrome b subunit [bacterium]
MKSYISTSVGKKFGVAVTGLILYGFVVLHMLGNLKAFMGMDSDTGQHKLDHYAEFLREMGETMLGHSTVLWITRVVLLIALLIHLFLVFSLTLKNKAARPIGYNRDHYGSSTVASRTMIYSGPLLLVFIVYHIFHMTIGSVHYHGFVDGQVYNNVVSAFQVSALTAVYVLSVGLLGLHLYHGVWSLFQTLGFNNVKYNCQLRLLAQLSGFFIFLGFASVPVAVYLGIIH